MSSAVATPPPPAGAPLTKKILTADHPTWCPGCGDFAVLHSFYRVLEKLQYPHEKIVTFAGIASNRCLPGQMGSLEQRAEKTGPTRPRRSRLSNFAEARLHPFAVQRHKACRVGTAVSALTVSFLR